MTDKTAALRACAEARPSTEKVGEDLWLVKTLVGTMKRIPAPPSWVGYMEQLIAEIEWLHAWVPPPQATEYHCVKHGHRILGSHPRLDATMTCPEFVTYDEPRLNATPHWQVCGSPIAPPRAEALAPHPQNLEKENADLSRVPVGDSSETSSPPRSPQRGDQ